MNVLKLYFINFYNNVYTTANSVVLALLRKPFFKVCCWFCIWLGSWFFVSDASFCSGNEEDMLEALNKLKEEKILWLEEKKEMEDTISYVLEKNASLEIEHHNLRAHIKSLQEEKYVLESKNHILGRQGVVLFQENMNLSQENIRFVEENERLREELAKHVDLDSDISEDSL